MSLPTFFAPKSWSTIHSSIHQMDDIFYPQHINPLIYNHMVTVSIATGLTSYIPMMYADNIEQGLQVCRLLKEIEPKEVYTVVSSADLSLNLEHVKDYSWKEELV